MKIGLKAVSVLIVALSVSVLFFTKKAQKPIETKRLPAVRAVNENSGIAPTPTQSPRPTTTVPTGISFKPVELGTARVQLQPLIDVVSNAVLSVDRILKAKDYQVQEFSRTKWLTAEDNARLTKWRIFPHMTNAVVNSVKAIVYQDEAMTQKDLSRGFEMSFQQGGKLHNFYWADKHEIVRISTNETGFEYARDLGGKRATP